MRVLSFPMLWALVLVPALGGLVVRRVRQPERARALAVAVAGVALLLALGLLGLYLHGGDVPLVSPWGHTPRLGLRLQLAVDAVSAPVLPLATLIVFGLVLGGSRVMVDRHKLSALLLTTSALLGVVCAQDFALLLLFWLGSLVPTYVLIRRRERQQPESRLERTYRLYLLGGSLPLVAVAAALGWLGYRQGLGAPWDLAGLAARGVPVEWQLPLFVLLMMGVAVRMALVPVHSWAPYLLERGPFGLSILLVNVHVGLYLLVRVALPLLPRAWAAGLPLLVGLGLLGAVHGTVLALVQSDLRRMAGFILVSQSGMMLAGLASMNEQSVAGALLQSVSAGVALTGLMLVVRALEARTGTMDMEQLGGLVRRGPRMATFFFLLGVATLGFPGTLSFIGEDLLLHGVLEAHPLVALPMLLTTALNGVTLLRAFQRTFLGPYAHGRGVALERMEDLLPRERAVALGLCALAFVGGLFPGPLLRMREHEVERLVAQAPGAGHGQRR